MTYQTPATLTDEERDYLVSALQERGITPEQWEEGREAIKALGEFLEEHREYLARLAEYVRREAERDPRSHTPVSELGDEDLAVYIGDILQRAGEAMEAPDTRLPPLGYLMNASHIQQFTRLLTSGGDPRDSIVTRSERWEVEHGKDSITFKRTNRGEVQTFTITNPDILFPGLTTGKRADVRKRGTQVTRKLLPFVLQKMTQQHYPSIVRVELSELVELGAYKNVDSAYKAIERFVDQMRTVIFHWKRKGRGKPPASSKGPIFYHSERRDGAAYIPVNEMININDFASTWTVFPRWAYALKPGAFDLVRYVFFIARQNTRQINENNGRFTISMQVIAENMGLPSVDDVQNRRHRQQIRTPIENAIEEIEQRVAETPEAKGLFFITPHVDEATTNIETWLSTGYVEVQLLGDYVTSFTTIAEKQKELVAEARKSKRRKSTKGKSATKDGK